MSELWEWNLSTTCPTTISPLLGVHISGAGSYTSSRPLVTSVGLVDWPSRIPSRVDSKMVRWNRQRRLPDWPLNQTFFDTDISDMSGNSYTRTLAEVLEDHYDFGIGTRVFCYRNTCLQWRWGLHSKFWPGRRCFQFMIISSAFMTEQCTEVGIDALSRKRVTWALRQSSFR